MTSKYTHELWIIICLTIYSLAVALLAGKNKKSESKILIYVSLFSIYVYSGYGISIKEVANSYLIKYFIFVVIYSIAISFGINAATRYKINSSLVIKVLPNERNKHLNISNNLLMILVFIFFITLFIPLVYPSFRLLDIFRLPSMNMGDIYAKINASKTNAITKLASTIQTFLLPFFMIALYRYSSSKRKLVSMSIILLWVYLDYLQFTYLGRYDLVIYFAFTVIFLTMFDGDTIILDKRKILWIGIFSFFVVLPLLNMLVYIREGWTNANVGVIANIANLIDSETYYPLYYDTCINAFDSKDIPTFFGWLLTLPIPSIIWPGKPDVTVSYRFTYLLTGREFGQAFYSSLLPSILGEGLMIFGEHNYWISALVTGLVSGYVLGYVSKYKETKLFVVYIALLSAKMGRAGVVSFLPNVINGALSLILYIILSELKSKRKNKI